MKIRAFYLGSILFGILSLGLAAREPLTFEERVKAQEAIERVYYNHRIWPKENPQPKPPFEKMVSKEQIEAKVTDYLKKCSALDKFWQRPIIASQLQAEMERMARGTKDPATLNELFAALNNDPYLIAECLARPILAERLLSNWYANDERFHKETREKAEDALKTLTPENFCSYPEDQFSKMTYRLEVEGREEMEEPEPEDNAVNLDEKEFSKMLSEMPDERKLSGVIEKNDCFVITHTKEKHEGGIEVESLSFKKTSADEWIKNQNLAVAIPETGSACFYLPETTEGSCTEGWRSSSLNWTGVPDPRSGFAAVWTGTEMIVWGGNGYNSGGKYSPATDSWSPTSTGKNCPSGRRGAKAVWTGTEMIVWGGAEIINPGLNTGGRYDPSTDTWTATSTDANVPSGRLSHTAVWTGTEMIVWGGYVGSNYFNTGGRYNPIIDTWTPTSTGTNCPSARGRHTAVWTGAGGQMIIWGGYSYSIGLLNDMGLYDPSTDSWVQSTQYTNCPAPRRNHCAVWTDTGEMIVWGGWISSGETNTGGRYAPATDSWVPTSTESNCPIRRQAFTAVWTGAEMIIWGGYRSGYGISYKDGGRYSPATDAWTPTSIGANCPIGRYGQCAFWTGTEMIVWGGSANGETNTGGRYDPATDSWVPTSISDGSGTPAPRSYHTAVWTGNEMIIWGGYGNSPSYCNDGGCYQPATDSWTATSIGTNCPAGRGLHSAVWTGEEMIVWGGVGGLYRNDGGRYSVYTDAWIPIQIAGAPAGRYNHTAVWTGTYMIIWGGHGYIDVLDGSLNDGGRYVPSTDVWVATSTGIGCPSNREEHTAVWTGSEMIIWGGQSTSLPFYKYDGGRYNPMTNVWSATSIGTGCPTPGRSGHTAVWTGQEMIVWGGADASSSLYFNTGGRYNPGNDSWITTSTIGDCPTARRGHTAVWTGTVMIVWGGDFEVPEGLIYENTGSIYNPLDDSWVQTSSGADCPTGRADHTAVWTGGEMIVWGASLPTDTNTGGIFYIPYAPSGFSNNLAGDSAGCSDGGVLVEWSSPTWGDGSTGTRNFDILREGTPIATGLSESTLSYTDTTGDNGVSYLYQVRANNGCGLSTTTAGMSATDNVGTTPDEVSNFDDVYSWDPVSGADGYRLYRGTLADLPNLMTLTTDGCLRYEGTATSYDLSGDDPSEATGSLYWYIVTAYTGACEGTAGEGTGFTRVLSSSGACP